MPTSYYAWASLGLLGVLLIGVALAFAMVGIFGRDSRDALPRFVGTSLTLTVLGSLSFIGSLLLLVSGAT